MRFPLSAVLAFVCVVGCPAPTPQADAGFADDLGRVESSDAPTTFGCFESECVGNQLCLSQGAGTDVSFFDVSPRGRCVARPAACEGVADCMSISVNCNAASTACLMEVCGGTLGGAILGGGTEIYCSRQ